MKYKFAAVLTFVLLLVPVSVFGQDSDQYGSEPTVDELGAPLYPGAVFIRRTTGLDPYHETAMYVTLVPMNLVEDFMRRKLPEKRVVYFSDEEVYLTAFLLKTWSQFPGEPTRNELEKLSIEPTVQIRAYDPFPLEPLAEYFEKIPDAKMKVHAIRNGEALLLYTFQKTEEYQSEKQIIATWKETSRDLTEYYGSILDFKPDKTYTFTYTDENIAVIADKLSSSDKYKGKPLNEIIASLKENNPERGRYVILKNTITLVSDNPLDGVTTKSGLADVGRVSLKLELIYKPRLTFLRSSR